MQNYRPKSLAYMQSILSEYNTKTHQEVYFKKDEKIPKVANWILFQEIKVRLTLEI